MNLPFTASSVDRTRIVAAIQAAERTTSGEIRVLISRTETTDALADAKKHFERLGMTQTAERNGVLIFVSPTSRAFAVLGDTGIHEKCGNAFWTELAQAMEARFRRGDLTGGIVSGLERAGALLATHFPRGANDRNELPDDVEEA